MMVIVTSFWFVCIRSVPVFGVEGPTKVLSDGVLCLYYPSSSEDLQSTAGILISGLDLKQVHQKWKW